MTPVIEINEMAALAAAMYCQLKVSSFDIVNDFRVTVTCDAEEEWPLDICGYIKTNHCEKETTLEFTIEYCDLDAIRITTTQDININLPEQNDDDYVAPVCLPRPNESTVWVDFGKRRVFYKWEDSLSMDLDAKLTENKLVLNAIAQNIIGTILAKVEKSVD